MHSGGGSTFLDDGRLFGCGDANHFSVYNRSRGVTCSTASGNNLVLDERLLLTARSCLFVKEMNHIDADCC